MEVEATYRPVVQRAWAERERERGRKEGRYGPFPVGWNVLRVVMTKDVCDLNP